VKDIVKKMLSTKRNLSCFDDDDDDRDEKRKSMKEQDNPRNSGACVMGGWERCEWLRASVRVRVSLVRTLDS
jgi:hypothetical protein